MIGAEPYSSLLPSSFKRPVSSISFSFKYLKASNRRDGISLNCSVSSSTATQSRLVKKHVIAPVPVPEQRSRTLSPATVKYSTNL